MGDTSYGPFQLPHGHGTQDAVQLFHLHDIERSHAEAEKKSKVNFKVHQKTTSTSRIKGVARRVSLIQHEMVAKSRASLEKAQLCLEDQPSHKMLKTGVMAAGSSRGSPRKAEEQRGDGFFLTEPTPGEAEEAKSLPAICDIRAKREVVNTRQFVRKKRDIFLVQMSLDVTKAEILKLEENVRKREEALKKSQSMLDEDTARFEAFLNNNDKRARTARKNAEAMTKKKVDAQGRIKQLKTSVAEIESEITELQDVQLGLNRYADFLTRLTPQEWLDAQKKRIQDFFDKEEAEYVKRERERWFTEKLEPECARMQEELDQEMEERRSRMTRRAYDEEYKSRRELLVEYREVAVKQCPSDETLRARWCAEEKPNIALPEEEQYFKEPKQLMDILVQQEEKNLSFIQEAQALEESVDEVEMQSTKMRQEVEEKISAVRTQVTNLERVIQTEVRKTRDAQERLSRESGTEAQDKKTEDLKAKIRSVYALCGIEADHDAAPVQMLKSIEVKLDELLKSIEEVELNSPDGSEFIMQLERQLEHERRQRLRQERKDEEAKKQAARLKASLKRSQAPVYKRVGKPIMFRSAPPVSNRKTVVVDDTEEKENEEQRRLFGFYMDKDGIPQTVLGEEKKAEKLKNDIS